jgi:hypothetical protein
MSLVDRRRVQADGLIVGTVPEALSVAYQKLRVETPSNDGASDNIIVTVGICSLGDIKELSASVRESSSRRLATHVK